MDYASQQPMNGRAPGEPDPGVGEPAEPTANATVRTLEAGSAAAASDEVAQPLAPATASTPHGRPDPRPSFLAELAQAMQAAAGHERDRIAATVADDAAAHIGRVKSRAAAETDELRRLAEEDVQGIAAWEEAEIERVRATAARRTEARRDRLERYLGRHAAIIDMEIDGVNGAVEGYRKSLDGFFDRLAGSSDPGEIAALASSLPEPPDLDAVRAESRTAAIARFAEEDAAEGGDDEPDAPAGPDAGGEAPGMVGVMDPAAVEDRAAETTAEPEPETSAEPEPETGAEAEFGTTADPGPAPSGAGPTPPEGAAATMIEAPTAVARLLRTIAPWTVSDDRADNGASPKPG